MYVYTGVYIYKYKNLYIYTGVRVYKYIYINKHLHAISHSYPHEKDK